MLKTMLASIVSKNIKKKLIDWTIKEEDITEMLKQIRIALLNADVNLLVTKKFIKNIREKVVGMTIENSQDPQEVVLAIIKSELVKILGSTFEEISLDQKITKIMMIGLQGSGKTTSAAKLANYFKTKKAKSPLLVALDIYRPAAIEQLQKLSKEINVGFYQKGQQDPVKTADEAMKYAQENNHDLIIFDTAGRLQTNEQLMQELQNIRNKISPNEIIFVADGMAGQEMVNVAQSFNDILDITGLIITKLDSDARGGVAFSLIDMLGKPVYFTGVGEKVGSLELFYPDRMADRILGLGDILSLAEKAVEVVDENKAKKSIARMLSGKMDLEDLLVQMEQLTNMGGAGSILKMMPNAPKIDEEQIFSVEQKMKIWKVLMSSMTLKERRNPALFRKHPNRKIRVINGSGRKPNEFNQLISEWEKAKKKMDEIGNNLKRGKNPLSGFGGMF